MAQKFKLLNGSADKTWKDEDKVLMKKLLKIAKKHDPNGNITTLRKRWMDCLDYHDVEITNLRNMLKEAYALGKQEAEKGSEAIPIGE